MRVPADKRAFVEAAEMAGWTADKWDKWNRRRLIVKRLLSRVTDKQKTDETVEKLSSDSDSVVTINVNSLVVPCSPVEVEVDDYKLVFGRMRLALCDLQTPTSVARCEEVACANERDGHIRVAMSTYVRILHRFPDLFTKLGEENLREIFNQRLVHQINLFSIFWVNDDTNGWLSMSSCGETRDTQFSDFVGCLSHDGVDSQSYVQFFSCLCRTFRRTFQRDWSLVLLTLTLIDLFSVDKIPEAEQQRSRFASFLQRYLELEHFAESKALLRYCTQDFTCAMEVLVQLHKAVLFQYFLQSVQTEQTQVSELPVAIASKVSCFFEPIVSHLLSNLTL